jgi:hypothetical protein
MASPGLLAVFLMFVALPIAVLLDLFKLWSLYQYYKAKQGPRGAALTEASHGAALIVLPVIALLRFDLPPWSSLAAGVLMIMGCFWLYNGAVFSVGWRDPKLIARAVIKIGLAVLVFRAIGNAPSGKLDPAGMALSLLGWWLLVTGLTKLLLLLRGTPGLYVDHNPMPHGTSQFSNPNDAAKGLSK